MWSIIKHLFKFQFLVIALGILAGIYYPQWLNHFKMLVFQVSSNDDPIAVQFGAENDEILFTKESLAKFDGATTETPIYLSILGSVYDVSRGRDHYGVGCSYNFFAGRDASKSFFTGDFDNYSENSDDVLSLEPKDLLSLATWRDFYQKDYIYKGKLIGRFFDESGAKTTYSYQFDAQVQLAKDQKAEEEKLKEIFPPCNIEWSASTGTRVWCSDESGGVKRDYVGVPRKYFEPGKETYRCACVGEDKIQSPLLKPYDGCDSKSDVCFYNVD